MSDENPVMGGNTKEDLKRRVDRRLEAMEDGDEVKEKLADFKKEDRADGFTEKAISQVVKEKRKGPEFLVAQLTLEAEVKAYREATGVTTDLAEAQRIAREAADVVPEAKSEKKKKHRRKGMN